MKFAAEDPVAEGLETGSAVCAAGAAAAAGQRCLTVGSAGTLGVAAEAAAAGSGGRAGAVCGRKAVGSGAIGVGDLHVSHWGLILREGSAMPKGVLVVVVERVFHAGLAVRLGRGTLTIARHGLVDVSRNLAASTLAGCRPPFLTAASSGQFSPLASLLVEFGSDNDASSRGLATASEFAPPGVSAFLNSAKG